MLVFALFENFAPLVDCWLLPILFSLFKHGHWIIGLIIFGISALFTALFIEGDDTDAIENFSRGILLYAVVGLPIAYKLLLTGHYVWVTTIVGSLLVCAYYFRKYKKDYDFDDFDEFDMSLAVFSPIIDAICIPLVYTCYKNGEMAFAISIAVGLAIISLMYIYSFREDLLVIIIGIILMAIPIVGLFFIPELTVKIAGWIAAAIFLVFYAIISRKEKPVAGGGGGSTFDDFTPGSSSFSFPSQIMSGNETYDLVESLGSKGRYKSRATGEYREFSDYELRPNTINRSIDD